MVQCIFSSCSSIVSVSRGSISRRFFSKRKKFPRVTVTKYMATPDGEVEVDVPQLTLYNSLTRKKDIFVPLKGSQVTWYSCGPTVYDASHMGHARSYVTFDIMRRILSNYFGYDIFYVMNITDIDDKIINRGRQTHLFNEYVGRNRPLGEVIENVKEALLVYAEKLKTETDKDKVNLLTNTVSKVREALAVAENDTESPTGPLIETARDPLAKWLDKKYGASISDHSIFSSLTRHWEEEYHRDMESLNVLPPDVLTRVTEYVPEVIRYVQKIIDNGYGYESNGSVYFDTVKFSTDPNHRYAKLMPEAVGDLKALAEGEGELSISADRLKEKQHNNDFALWKASKPGEPSWPSPWGAGRPGWHIECSVMACEILGSRADIHTGGVDLKFPHHDNEIAQAEAHYQSNDWMTYFLHSGHLTIEGCKMSKSLKNFITIKEALRQYSSSQIRLFFLLHPWDRVLDYSDRNMVEATNYEKAMKEFFLTVKDMARKSPRGVDGYVKWEEPEKKLNSEYLEKQLNIHVALCDSLNTPRAMALVKELIYQCNLYIEQEHSNTQLLAAIARYISRLMRIFGVIAEEIPIGYQLESAQPNLEDTVMRYVKVLADFREKVREIALEQKVTPILGLCDWLRNDALVDLGVRLEDKKGYTAIKLVDQETLRRERAAEKELIEEKKRAKEEHKQKLEQLKLEREAKARVRPQDMFYSETEKYSQFDEAGIPTHDASGEPLSQKQIEKLKKLWLAQEKKYNKIMGTDTNGTK